MKKSIILEIFLAKLLLLSASPAAGAQVTDPGLGNMADKHSTTVCRDDPEPNPAAGIPSFAAHAYVSTRVGKQKEFSCETSKFHYKAVDGGDYIQVTSTYRDTGKIFKTISFHRKSKISYGPDGIVNSYSKDGKLDFIINQSIIIIINHYIVNGHEAFLIWIGKAE